MPGCKTAARTELQSTSEKAGKCPPENETRRLKNINIISTCVSAFLEIHQSLQCKIFQYTFLGQYPIKFWDFLSLCKIQQPAWQQLDQKKLRPSEIRFSHPYIKRLKKHALVWDIRLWKTLNSKSIEFETYQDGWENKTLVFTNFLNLCPTWN